MKSKPVKNKIKPTQKKSVIKKKPLVKKVKDAPAVSAPETDVFKDDLSPQHRAFVEAYLGEAKFVGCRAAEAAKYNGDNATLRMQASRLLKMPKIAKELKARLDDVMSANEVLQSLADIARGRITDVLDAENNLDLEGARETGADGLVKKIKTKRIIFRDERRGEETETTIQEVDLYSRLDALQTIGRYHKLFTDRLEATGKNGMPLFSEAKTVIYIPDNGRDPIPPPSPEADD